jgi:AhpC/TSA antioxidant enzyme
VGARVIAVGTGSEAQARQLMDRGMPYPCLVDPDARLHRALGIGRVGWRALLMPETYSSYWRAWRHGVRRGQVTGDWRRLSGVAILDAGGRLRWVHRAGTVGDYPPVTRLLDEVSRLRDEPAPARDG